MSEVDFICAKLYVGIWYKGLDKEIFLFVADNHKTPSIELFLLDIGPTDS